MAILADVKRLHKRTQSCDRKICDFCLTNHCVWFSFFQFLILEENIFKTNLLNNFFILIKLNDFTILLIFQGLLVAQLFNIGDLFSWYGIFQFSVFPKLIHNLKHIVFQTQGCISLAFKVYLDYLAILFHINPSYVSIIQIYLVVQPSVDNFFHKSVAGCVYKVEFILKIRKSFQYENSILLNQFSFLELYVIK